MGASSSPFPSLYFQLVRQCLPSSPPSFLCLFSFPRSLGKGGRERKPSAPLPTLSSPQAKREGKGGGGETRNEMIALMSIALEEGRERERKGIRGRKVVAFRSLPSLHVPTVSSPLSPSLLFLGLTHPYYTTVVDGGGGADGMEREGGRRVGGKRDGLALPLPPPSLFFPECLWGGGGDDEDGGSQLKLLAAIPALFPRLGTTSFLLTFFLPPAGHQLFQPGKHIGAAQELGLPAIPATGGGGGGRAPAGGAQVAVFRWQGGERQGLRWRRPR